jgi:hypothetical protein
MTDIRRLFNFIRDGFNRKVDADPAFRQLVCGFNKSIVFVLSDNGTFNFVLRNGQVMPISEGMPLTWDIKATSDTQNLLALLSGKLDPMAAMVSRKLRISASIQDVAWLKRFLSLNRSTISCILKDYGQV